MGVKAKRARDRLKRSEAAIDRIRAAHKRESAARVQAEARAAAAEHRLVGILRHVDAGAVLLTLKAHVEQRPCPHVRVTVRQHAPGEPSAARCSEVAFDPFVLRTMRQDTTKRYVRSSVAEAVHATLAAFVDTVVDNAAARILNPNVPV